MRGSMLYNEIYPLIAEAQKRQIDRVLVERNRVVIYTVFPLESGSVAGHPLVVGKTDLGV